MNGESTGPDSSTEPAAAQAARDSAGLPAHDRLLDERGKRCPAPVITLGRMASADPGASLLLLADDPAAATDVPAWCGLRGRTLAWVGPAPDGVGTAYLVLPSAEPAATQ